MEKITDENFDLWVTTNPIAILMFSGPSCAGCQPMAAILEDFGVEHNNVSVGEASVAGAAPLATRMRVSSLPTTIIFYHGAPAHRITGPTTKWQLSEMVQTVIST